MEDFNNKNRDDVTYTYNNITVIVSGNILKEFSLFDVKLGVEDFLSGEGDIEWVDEAEMQEKNDNDLAPIYRFKHKQDSSLDLIVFPYQNKGKQFLLIELNRDCPDIDKNIVEIEEIR